MLQDHRNLATDLDLPVVAAGFLTRKVPRWSETRSGGPRHRGPHARHGLRASGTPCRLGPPEDHLYGRGLTGGGRLQRRLRRLPRPAAPAEAPALPRYVRLNRLRLREPEAAAARLRRALDERRRREALAPWHRSLGRQAEQGKPVAADVSLVQADEVVPELLVLHPTARPWLQQVQETGTLGVCGWPSGRGHWRPGAARPLQLPLGAECLSGAWRHGARRLRGAWLQDEPCGGAPARQRTHVRQGRRAWDAS